MSNILNEDKRGGREPPVMTEDSQTNITHWLILSSWKKQVLHHLNLKHLPKDCVLKVPNNGSSGKRRNLLEVGPPGKSLSL